MFICERVFVHAREYILWKAPYIDLHNRCIHKRLMVLPTRNATSQGNTPNQPVLSHKTTPLGWPSPGRRKTSLPSHRRLAPFLLPHRYNSFSISEWLCRLLSILNFPSWASLLADRTPSSSINGLLLCHRNTIKKSKVRVIS